VARARNYPEQENEVILPLLPLEPRAPYKARWVWAGAVILASSTCPLQFAKASAATLLQQEKSNSADVQRGRVNISGFICTVVIYSSRRRSFGEFESMARGRGSERQCAKNRSTKQHPRVARETARSSSALNFRVDTGLGEMGVRCHKSATRQNPQFYVQRSSGFCWIPHVVRRLLK
jgi:hypothetical protein